MSQVNRISGGKGINYDNPITFSYNDQDVYGYEGDTVASALLANNIKLVARSFKYGRPRGIVTAGADEPNGILQVGATEATQIPNVRATQQEIFEGLVCEATSGWPSLKWDFIGLVGKVGSKLLPPGFYYKTFMFPAFMWHTYEWMIRRLAGFGRSPREVDPDIYDKLNHHCDLLIVGAGPAGLSAAVAAAMSDARVILVHEQPFLGGSLADSDTSVDGNPARDWINATAEMFEGNPNVIVLKRTTAVGYHDGNFVVAHERLTDHLPESDRDGKPRQRIHRIHAKRVLIASGAQERTLVFGNNDVPGCMTATAVATYIRQYGVVPGRRLVLFTNNDEAYDTAFAWQDAGRDVAAVIDTREQLESPVVTACASRGIQLILGSGITEVTGGSEVTAVKVAKISVEDHSTIGPSQTIACDIVASSGGFSPVVHLTCHTGVKPVWDEDLNAFVPGTPVQPCVIAGGITGERELGKRLEQGINAATAALTDLGFSVPETPSPEVDSQTMAKAMPIFHIPHQNRTSRAPKQFVDYQLDVSAADIELANREGFESIEHVKRYTALGFGTDQGKLSNVNGIAIAAKSLGKSMSEVGTTMFRPNYSPVTFGAMAGRDCGEFFDPIRYTAIQPWHEARGAKFEDVGQWKRPWYFPVGNEDMDEAVYRECRAVRNQVGILDASTLGKIDIQGPDAAEFLHRVYTNPWMKLPVGQCRYGLMCGEDGMVMDDGVTARLGENHYLMHTTTGGAARILEWLELWHQTEWPELNVYFTSVTDQWVTATISGPKSRDVLSQLTDEPLGNEAFPFMHWRAADVAGIPARIYRISFTGELSYEINVQANYGLALWEALIAAGEPHGITPYGTESMHVLRAEKGFIIVGQDTDGSITPEDLGLDWAIGKKKKFSFLGRRGMAREDCVREDRKQLVGLLTADQEHVLPEGGQIIATEQYEIPVPMLGHVTSSYYSPTLERSIALALVKGGHNKRGETVYIPDGDGVSHAASICEPLFYDHDGERQNV